MISLMCLTTIHLNGLVVKALLCVDVYNVSFPTNVRVYATHSLTQYPNTSVITFVLGNITIHLMMYHKLYEVY